MNIIIVDDEKVICDTLEKYIRSYYEENKIEHNIKITVFENEFKLLDYLENGNKADVIFLDIRLKDSNGIDIAIRLQEMDSSLKIVFITGYIEYAKEIFEAKPVYFMVKPISKKDMNKVLDRIEMDYQEGNRDIISFKIDQVVYCIDKKDIYYIEADAQYLNIFTKDKSYCIRGKFAEWYEKLKDTMVMCHRSYLVNLDKIDSINKFEVRLISGKSIPMSRRKREGVEKRVLGL